MTDKQAALLAGCLTAIILTIMFASLAIVHRLDHTAQAIEQQTQKCMLGDDR